MLHDNYDIIEDGLNRELRPIGHQLMREPSPDELLQAIAPDDEQPKLRELVAKATQDPEAYQALADHIIYPCFYARRRKCA